MDRLREAEGSEFQAAMTQAVGREDLIAYLLERLETADFERAQIEPLSYLLRSVLAMWHVLPRAPSMDRNAFLERVVLAGAAQGLSAAVVAAAWGEGRILAPEHLLLVERTRPLDLDRQFEQEQGVLWSRFGSPRVHARAVASGSGAAQPRMYLVLLEDLLRSFLEVERRDEIFVYTKDPSMFVRTVALRLLLDSGDPAEWHGFAAALEGLCSEARVEMAENLVESLPADVAAGLLQDWGHAFGDSYAAPWLILGLEAGGTVLAATLVEELALQAPPDDPAKQEPSDDFGSMEAILRQKAVDEEARLRVDLITTFVSLRFHNGEPLPRELLADIFARDWNPRTRGHAWWALATSGEADDGRVALELLDANRSFFAGRKREAYEGDFAALARSLAPADQDRLRSILTDLSFGEEAIQRILLGGPMQPTVSADVLSAAAALGIHVDAGTPNGG